MAATTHTIHAALLASTLAVGCLPTQISGASAPTEHTFKLTDADLAYVEQDDCAQDWVTGNAEADLELAHAKLKDRGVKIRGRNFVAKATAFERVLWVAKDFDDLDDATQARLLSHEHYHYCQRDELGDIAFEESYFNSPGRWRIETPAYRQTFRTMIMQCEPISTVAKKIDGQVKSMRDMYLLWDIEPEQYETVTRKIWRSVLDLDVPAHCSNAN